MVFAKGRSLFAWLIVSMGALAHAQTVAPFYAGSYELHELGSVTNVPPNYGGVCFLAGSTDTLLLAGSSNNSAGQLYRVDVVRDGTGHITGFAGGATLFAPLAYNDGGIVYEPTSGVLFFTRYPLNEMGMMRAGSHTTDKVVDLTPLGVSGSVGALHFVPAFIPAAAGRLKVVSYSSGRFYEMGFTPDGAGTFNLGAASDRALLSGGPEGFIYVPPGSPLFSQHMLVSDWAAGRVSSYEVDANGDPLAATRQDFIQGLSGAEGALIDPITGDFIFSTFGGGNHLVAIRGFNKLATITGTVQLGDFVGATNTVPVTFELRAAGSSSPLETHTVLLNASGAYSFTIGQPAGSYDVSAKGSHWLRSVRGSVAVSSTGASGVGFSLVNGDVDGDNAVTVFDYNELSAAFDSSPGDAGWDPEADLDGDGAVTVFDYNVLSANFDLSGND